MGSLKQVSDRLGLVLRFTAALDEAGWEQEDLELLDAAKARELLAAFRGTMTAPEERGMDTEAQIGRAIAWYRKYADIALAPDEIRAALPERRPGFDRLIVVAAGMTPNRCYETLARQYGAESVWRYMDDLDCEIVSVRSATKLYAVWCRNQREADEEHRNKAAQSFNQNDCLTLEERLVFGGLYFGETGQHLDVQCWTICGGSRSRGGDVPNVNWNPGYRLVNVHWWSAEDRSLHGAVRAAVSL